ncbi:MAG: cytochrome c biogenesis protein CcdA [Zetaproteobacteria bacterium]|nr:MAG: cytochrome c biogenesis protein CcdA [Zetaproteobacteria bacterium]
MIELSVPVAVAAGLLSFLSPCVLPLVPAYLSYLSGVGAQALEGKARARVFAQAVWFVLGFSAVFVLLGASATAIGRFLLAHLIWFERIAGVLVVVFGLHFLGVLRWQWLMQDKRFDFSRVPVQGGLGALLVGAAFAFGWTPCVGPILGAILALAGTQQTVGQGMLLLAAYSAGLAVPFLLAAWATGAFLRASILLRPHLAVIEKISGALLVGVGALLLTGSFSELSALIIRWAPWLAELEGVLTP